MDYGKILRRSWDIIWKNKFMIVLGFLAALGSGGANFSGGGGNSGSSFDGSEFGAIPELSENIGAVLATAGVLIIGLLCFFLIVGILLWLLRLTAQAGLIDGAARLDAGEKVTFGEAFSAGWKKIGRMVGIDLILFGIFFVFAIIGSVILFGAVGASFAGAAGSTSDDIGAILASVGVGLFAIICCLMCVLIIYAIVVSIIHPFAQRAAVLEDMGVIDSIRRGWGVIRANLGEVIILLLIFMLIGFLVGAITFAVFIPLAAISFAPIGLRLFGGDAIQVLDVVLAAGGFLCLILVGAVINALYASFRSTAFTLAYQEFVNKNLKA